MFLVFILHSSHRILNMGILLVITHLPTLPSYPLCFYIPRLGLCFLINYS
jgi:hypothetical protein